MGVTTTIMIGFWLGSSYIEYRVIKAIPRLKPLFDNALGGILLSIAIGAFVSFIMGPAAGVGAALGQLLGLATNHFTYTMYDGGGKALHATKAKYGEFKDFTTRNKGLIDSAANTCRLGVKTLGVIFLTFMFIIGLPFRAVEGIQKIRTR